MPTRRAFLAGGLTGAAALLLSACSDSADADLPVEGIRPMKYGDARSQIGELLLPDEFGPYPVVVIIHGGWWQPGWDRRSLRDLARNIVREGYATWNLEYRLVGEPGGGWPGTFEDVAAGIDLLAEKAPDYNLDLSRVVFLGHSAGGHLALWAAARSQFETGFTGANPLVEPTTVISLAGVPDLVGAAEQNLGNGAVQDLLGGEPDEIPLTYAVASPASLPPGPARYVLVHDTADEIVPVDQSRSFADVLRQRDAQVEYLEVPDADHFSLIVPNGDVWRGLQDRLGEFVTPPDRPEE